MPETELPVATAAKAALRDAGHTLETDRRVGLHAALDDATDSRLVRIVAERALERSGFDLLWAMSDAPDPAALFAAADALDLQRLYGSGFEAILGIMRAAVEAREDQIRSVGYQVHHGDELYQQAFLMADGHGVDRIMADVCSDVHFACIKREVRTPAQVQAHLKGVRGFELAAMYYVLAGAGNGYALAYPQQFLGPIQRVFFPSWPRV